MKNAMIFVMMSIGFLFCFSIFSIADNFSVKNEDCREVEKGDHRLAENVIEWPPDKIFFQMIDMKDDALLCVKDKVSKYKDFLIDECARKSAKDIKEEEFNAYKIKISKCSDTENLISFISKLRKYQGNKNEGELAFGGGIF